MIHQPALTRSRRRPADDGWGEETIVGGAEDRSAPAPAAAAAATAGSAPGRGRGSTAAGAPRRRAEGRAPNGRPHRVPFAVLLVGVVAAGMCALLGLNTATAASEVRERKLDSANSGLNATEEELSRSVATKQAPEQLNAMAARLGLVPAGSPAFLRINPDGSVTVLGHPARVVAPPVVRKLTPAEKAAAEAAKVAAAKAAKAKAAKAALAKAALAKAAQAKAAQAKGKSKASGATTKPGAGASSTPPSSPGTQRTPTTSPPAHARKTPPTPATAPSTTAPSATPTPTVTIPGGPR